jgi:hypothetical protein
MQAERHRSRVPTLATGNRPACMPCGFTGARRPPRTRRRCRGRRSR